MKIRDRIIELRRVPASELRPIWRKQHFVMSQGHYHWHEPCWYVVRKGETAKWCGDRTQSTMWEIKSLNPAGGKATDEKVGHGTQKPIECMARPIRNHGGKDDDVYDPFLGSGTTIIAAEQLSRRCYGLEIEPRYCDVIVSRWEKLTGRQATLDNDGGTFSEVKANRLGAGELATA